MNNETTSTLGRMTDDEKTALQNAITNKKGEYRKRANKDKGEIAIYPMMYNRIRRIADRYSISVTQNEIEFMIDDCIARYTSAEWDTTNAGKGRDEIIKKHAAVRLSIYSKKTTAAWVQIIPARKPHAQPRTPEQWLHGLMLAVTRRYVSQRGWLVSDVEVAKREEWRDLYRCNRKTAGLKSLPVEINHMIELDGLPPRFMDAVIDGRLDKTDLQIIGEAKSGMHASSGSNHNYNPKRLGWRIVSKITNEGATESEQRTAAQKRLKRIKAVDSGMKTAPVTEPIACLRKSARYAAPQSEVVPTSDRNGEFEIHWVGDPAPINKHMGTLQMEITTHREELGMPDPIDLAAIRERRENALDKLMTTYDAIADAPSE